MTAPLSTARLTKIQQQELELARAFHRVQVCLDAAKLYAERRDFLAALTCLRDVDTFVRDTRDRISSQRQQAGA
jgi:hypothetical protein